MASILRSKLFTPSGKITDIEFSIQGRSFDILDLSKPPRHDIWEWQNMAQGLVPQNSKL